MLAPVSERITEAVENRLASLLDGDQVSEVSEIVRLNNSREWQEEYTPKHGQIILEVSSERNPDHDQQGNPPKSGMILRVRLTYILMPSEKDGTPLDRMRQFAVADIRKALTGQIAWHKWGNLAYNSEFETPEDVDKSDGVAGVVLPFSVMYRTDEDDPYEVRS